MTIFAKHSILDVWQGSEYASGLLKLFRRGSKRDTREGDIYQTNYSIQTKNFLLVWSHKWKYNIQANEGLTKVEEKWSTIKFDVFVLSFFLSSVINRGGACYFLHASNKTSGACAGVCACDRTHQMEKTPLNLLIFTQTKHGYEC